MCVRLMLMGVVVVMMVVVYKFEFVVYDGMVLIFFVDVVLDGLRFVMVGGD